MAIQFACSCGKVLQASDEHAGRQTACPACGKEMAIPALDQAVQPTVPAAPTSPVREELPERPVQGDSRTYEVLRDQGPPATSGKAIASLIFGLLSFCLPILASLPAIILGIIGLANISQSGGRLKGQGLAIAGIILGVLGGLVIAPLVMVIALLVPAVQKVREAAANAQSMNNLKQMGIALHNHHGTMNTVPSAVNSPPGMPPGMFPQPGQPSPPMHSWRAAILPYLEEEGLFRQYNFNEPWNGPNNRLLHQRMPKVFAHPAADPAVTAQGLTHYRMFIGPATMGGDSKARINFANITDGTSNTIWLVEAADPVPWLEPEGLSYDAQKPLPALGLPFSSTFNVLLVDGSVHRVRKNFNPSAFRAALTRNGGEPFDIQAELLGK